MAKQDLMGLLKKAGFRGQGLAHAYAIALAESGGRSGAHNTNAKTGDNSYGLFQINMLGGMGPARRKQYGLSANEDLFDPLTNAKVAYQLSHGGTNFKPWTTFTSGKYKDYLGQSGAQVTGDSMASAKKAQTSIEDYGYVNAFLKQHKDVAKVLKKAVAQGYSAQRAQAEIKGTKWWKTRDESQRQWDVLQAENPAEAERRLRQAEGGIRQRAQSMGIQLEKGDAARYAKRFTVNGSSDVEQAAVLAREFSLPGSGQATTGTASQYEAVIKAHQEAYGITLSRATEANYIRDMLAGRLDTNGIEDVFREQAKTFYPSIAGQIDTGQTVRQYLSPYMEVASKELGLPSEDMSTTDPRWTKALSGGGDKGKDPMNVDQWTRTIRTDPSFHWDKTLNAQQQAAGMASQIGHIMGAMG